MGDINAQVARQGICRHEGKNRREMDVKQGSTQASVTVFARGKNKAYRALLGISKHMVWEGLFFQTNNPVVGGPRHWGNRAVPTVAILPSR